MTAIIADTTDRQVSVPETADPSAAKIRAAYDKGTRAIRYQQLQYLLNSSFIQGQQWVYRHAVRMEILHLPHDPRRVRATIPRLGPESRRIMAKLLKRPLVFQVTPTAADDATIHAAKLTEGVITHTSEKFKWNRLREELAWTIWKGGTGALCLDWDASAGTTLSVDPVDKKVTGTGDIKVSCLAITEFCTEPGTKDIEKAAWWIKAQALPTNEVKHLYNLRNDPASDAIAAVSPLQAQLLQRQAGSAAPLNMSLVITYYERPSPKNRDGVVATVVGQQIVDGPHPWPFPFKDRLNLVCARETIIEGQWTGHTVVSDAVPIQTALNAAWTSALEHMKQAGNARIMAEEGSQDLVNNLSDNAAEFIFYRQPFEHKWLSPPQMPAWWLEMPTRLQAAMDDALGTHDISRGEAPPNIQSGAGLSILQEQDDTPTGKLAQVLADAFGDLGTLVLQTYEAKVKAPESRKAMTPTAPGQIPEQLRWTGTDFLKQTTTTVPYDAIMPLNEAARFARLQFFVQSGMITSPRMASAYLDIPGMGGDFIEGIDPDVGKARRENYELAGGEPCIPVDFDNHAIHIEEHNDFRKSGRYERLSPDIKKLVDTHVQAHSTLAAEEAGEQALKAQHAPALAAAAQAGQAPGSALPPPSSSPQATLGASMGGAPGGGEPAAGEPPGQMPPLGIPPMGSGPQ